MLDIHKTKVMRTVALGDEFQLVHDLGDEWRHRCSVGAAKIDPDEHEAIVLSLLNRLSYRGEPGDRELADLLIAQLRGEAQRAITIWGSEGPSKAAPQTPP